MDISERRKLCVSLFLVCLSVSLVLFAVAKLAQQSAPPQIETFSESTMSFPAEETAPEPKEEDKVEETKEESKPLYVIRLVGNELRMSPYGTDDYQVLQSADPRTFREADRLRLIDGGDLHLRGACAAYGGFRGIEKGCTICRTAFFACLIS